MKTKKIILLLFLFVINASIYANMEEGKLSMKLSKAIINNLKIDSLINLVIHDNQEYLKKNCYLLMGIVKAENDTSYINIVVYEKKNFTLSCLDHDYPIIGYFKIDNQTVLILGSFSIDGLKFLNRKKKFIFKYQKEIRDASIPPPPRMSNPPSYFFFYEKDCVK